MRTIYLDHNATTPLDPAVAEAMRACQAQGFGNPSSQHALGRRARAMLEDAREAIASLLGADLGGPQPDQLIFTSGGTEANNLAVFGLAGGALGRAVTSGIEHPSVAEPFAELARRGWQVDYLGTSREGLITVEQLPELLERRPRFVSLMLGNNETGAVQAIAAAAQHANKAGVPLHTDAVQVVGKLEVDFRGLGVAALTCTAHKLHGPVGIGALVLRHGVKLAPRLFGGFQQAGIRPGTETVALAVGMCKALELWHADRSRRADHLRALRDRFESRLRSAWPELVVHAEGVERLPQTSLVSFLGLDRQALVIALDLAGICCSTGSACASGSSEPSSVLLAMGCDEAEISSALRFSFGPYSTVEEVDLAVERIHETCKGLRSRDGARKIAR